MVRDDESRHIRVQVAHDFNCTIAVRPHWQNWPMMFSIAPPTKESEIYLHLDVHEMFMTEWFAIDPQATEFVEVEARLVYGNCAANSI